MRQTSTSNEDERIPDPFGNEPPTSHLEERIVRALQQQRLLAGGSVRLRTRVLYSMAVSGLVLLAFAAGMYFSNTLSRTPASVEDVATSQGGNSMNTSRQQYLLLVYDSPGFEQGDGHAAEYGEWFRRYAKDGMLTAGEELHERGWTLMSDATHTVNFANNTVRSANGEISGFFLISAPSDDAAKEIAATCPHLKYNGTMELRPIKH